MGRFAPEPLIVRAPIAVIALGNPEFRDDGIAQRVMGRVRTLIGEIGLSRSHPHEAARRSSARSGLATPRTPAISGRGRKAPDSARGRVSVLGPAPERIGPLYDWIEGGSDPKALDPWLGDRERVVLMDAVRAGGPVGAVRHWHLASRPGSRLSLVRQFSAKKSGFEHLALWLEDDLPARGTDLIGIEPSDLSGGIGLSEALERRLATISSQVAGILVRILEEEGW